MKKYFLKCESDRSGAQINEEIFAWSYLENEGKEYLGSYGDYNFDDHSRLIELLNLPLTYREKPAEWENHQRINTDLYFGKDPNDFVNEQFLESLRNRCPNVYTDFKNPFPKISIHIRRGDVNKDNYPLRYIPNQYFLDHIVKIRDVSPNSRILIFSESVSEEGFDEFEKLGCELKLDCDLEFTWTELINSDVLIMSIGSFSYIPAMYNKGFVMFYPAWYKKLSHWNDNDDPNLYKNLKTFLNSRYEQL